MSCCEGQHAKLRLKLKIMLSLLNYAKNMAAQSTKAHNPSLLFVDNFGYGIEKLDFDYSWE